MTVDICGDDRFELIEEAKRRLLESTNIEDSLEEVAVLDSILFRFWQMGWLDQLREDKGAGTCHMRHRTWLEPDETKRYVPDKTCHMVLMEDIRGHAYQDVYECDRCGEQVIRETYMGKSEPPNFCPNCGARIEKGKDNGMGQE